MKKIKLFNLVEWEPGMLLEDVHSKDCPNAYKRKKIRKEAEEKKRKITIEDRRGGPE